MQMVQEGLNGVSPKLEVREASSYKLTLEWELLWHSCPTIELLYFAKDSLSSEGYSKAQPSWANNGVGMFYIVAFTRLHINR